MNDILTGFAWSLPASADVVATAIMMATAGAVEEIDAAEAMAKDAEEIDAEATEAVEAKAEAVVVETALKVLRMAVPLSMELKPEDIVKVTREKLVKSTIQWTGILELAAEREMTADKEPVLAGVTMPTRTLKLRKKAKKKLREMETSHQMPVRDVSAVPKRRSNLRLLKKNPKKR